MVNNNENVRGLNIHMVTLFVVGMPRAVSASLIEISARSANSADSSPGRSLRDARDTIERAE